MTSSQSPLEFARRSITRIANDAAQGELPIAALYEAQSTMTNLKERDPESFESFKQEAFETLSQAGIHGVVPGYEIKLEMRPK